MKIHITNVTVSHRNEITEIPDISARSIDDALGQLERNISRAIG